MVVAVYVQVEVVLEVAGNACHYLLVKVYSV